MTKTPGRPYNVSMPGASLMFEVLNATADDWESLEQIHGDVVRFDASMTPRLVAEEIIRLVRSGHFECQPKAPSDVDAVLAEPLEYWFRMTDIGRAWWESEKDRLDAL
jgi:hypothetical protein